MALPAAGTTWSCSHCENDAEPAAECAVNQAPTSQELTADSDYKRPCTPVIIA